MKLQRSLLFLLVLVGCIVCALPALASDFRVMSFNIRGDFDLEKASDSSEAWNSTTDRHRRDLVVSTIRDFGPDIIGVQEAFRHQISDLIDALPGYEFCGVGRDDGKEAGEYSAILYRVDRFQVKTNGNFWLSDAPDAPGSKHPDANFVRIASWAILADRETQGRELLVVNTHWDHESAAARVHSAKLIAQRAATLAGGRPAVVMGDMNAPEDSVPIKLLLGSELRLTDSYRVKVSSRDGDEATYHSFLGNPTGSRIDYVLFSHGLRVREADIIRTKFGDRFPSDHFPVTAILNWTE